MRKCLRYYDVVECVLWLASQSHAQKIKERPHDRRPPEDDDTFGTLRLDPCTNIVIQGKTVVDPPRMMISRTYQRMKCVVLHWHSNTYLHVTSSLVEIGRQQWETAWVVSQ